MLANSSFLTAYVQVYMLRACATTSLNRQRWALGRGARTYIAYTGTSRFERGPAAWRRRPCIGHVCNGSSPTRRGSPGRRTLVDCAQAARRVFCNPRMRGIGVLHICLTRVDRGVHLSLALEADPNQIHPGGRVVAKDKLRRLRDTDHLCATRYVTDHGHACFRHSHDALSLSLQAMQRV